MSSRRLLIFALCATTAVLSFVIPSVRPAPSTRRFNSTAINSVIANFTARMKDKNLATLFENCFPNTLDTTVLQWSRDDTFVITGDIPAMWLRDSTNQVMPYLPFLSMDSDLAAMVRGLVLRQFRSVLIDSHANAYNLNGSKPLGHQIDLRRPPMQWGLFEGKYELDSLCAVIKLAFHYVKETNDTTVLTTMDGSTSLFMAAADKIVGTMENQTLGSEAQFLTGNPSPYEFFRDNFPWEYDVFPRAAAVNTTGMVRSAFRPSDDQTIYDFLVPSNAMATVELDHLMALLSSARAVESSSSDALRKRVQKLRQGIITGLDTFASFTDNTAADSSSVLAYEVNGFGKQNRMDDANIPSLLSLPFIGYDRHLDLNNRTRQWVLSSKNPYYYCGQLGCGVGSPHTWPGFIWPMAITVRAMTTRSEPEIKSQLELLAASAQYTGFMHESFDPSNVRNFTRPWFAWANTLFGELILHVAKEHPKLIFNDGV